MSADLMAQLGDRASESRDPVLIQVKKWLAVHVRPHCDSFRPLSTDSRNISDILSEANDSRE